MPVSAVECEGDLWLVCESSGLAGYGLGVGVDMGALRAAREERSAPCAGWAVCVCVEPVRARDLDSWQRRRELLWESSGGIETLAGELLRERLHGVEPGRREVARARMSTEEVPAGSAEEVFEEDLRTLWIDRDDQGQRFKEWKNLLREYRGTPGRQPGGGPPSTVCKHMQHHGDNPKLWMNLWMKELGVSGKEWGSAAKNACTTKCRHW